MDGVGISADKKHNAVATAKMPFYQRLLREYPHTRLTAHGPTVGLLPGAMGNSEVGHITIGSGRVVNQFQRRFQIENESGRIAANPRLVKFIRDVKKDGGIVHLLGLTSDIGVHSDINEAITVARIVMAAGPRICFHFVADGRDTPQKAAEKYILKLNRAFAKEIKSGQLFFGTLSGRYYTMDRNQNWDRTQRSFDAIALGRAEFSAPDITSALRAAYARGETDEFIKPTIIKNDLSPVALAKGDGLLFTNYRSDRARQILQAFSTCSVISNVKRPANYVSPHVLSFSEYGGETDNCVPALLADIPIKNTLGDVLAAHGLRQLRISETEKYTHATYYFDGERTIDYPGEEKILIPSADVSTFDLKPEMSAAEITDNVMRRLAKYDVIIINYPNGDMIGHTGIMSAAIKAMETLDAQLARLVPAVLKLGGTMLITADHGSVEKMWDEKLNVAWTAHTTNKVPFIVVSGLPPVALAKGGGLSDIAPTILKILGLKQPKEMTGKSLIN